MTMKTAFSSEGSTPRRVVMLAYEGVQILDVTGPLQIFDAAGSAGGTPDYRIELVAPQAGEIVTSCGLRLGVDRTIDSFTTQDFAGIDSFLVAGGQGVHGLLTDPPIIRFVREAFMAARRTASVCTGAFLLAAAGLLDDRNATTHWSYVDDFRRLYPQVRIDADAIFVRDGHIWSSAGVTAGMDLALALVEEDHGREVARTIARRLVMFLMRPGGQSQYSAELAAQAPKSGRIADICAHIISSLDTDLSVSSLARLAVMSERTFTRHFAAEMHMTPAEFVERARLDAARRALADGDHSLEQVAEACGFGCVKRMRRTFLRHISITPGAYRERFRTARRPNNSSILTEGKIHVR